MLFEILLIGGALYVLNKWKGGGAAAPTTPADPYEIPKRGTPSALEPKQRHVSGSALRSEIYATAAELGLPEIWANWLAVLARMESSLDSAYRDTSDGAAALARAAWEQFGAQVADCKRPADLYTWGLGGPYGMTPLGALGGLFGTPGKCEAPSKAVFEPRVALVLAASRTTRLRMHSGYQAAPTVQNIARGWRDPTRVGVSDPAVDKAFAAAVEAEGLPATWAQSSLPALPLELHAFTVLSQKGWIKV